MAWLSVIFGKVFPQTVLIQEDTASGNYGRELSKITPREYEETAQTSQTITPPFQPLALAWLTHFASQEGFIYPLVVSPLVAGLLIMSLSCRTPEAAILNSEVLGQADDDFLNRPVQVMHSLLPSM
jgi:hypothetical protein